jgi:LacI family transcriptional regulator
MATIKDIAQHTGLSITTVSIVLNGKGARISDDAKRRIEEAKQVLHYEPNMLASSLRRGSTNIIGIVVSDLHPYFIKLAQLIERDIAKHGYQVLIVGSDENDEKCEAMIDNFINFRVAGMVLAVTEGLRQRIVRLNKQRIPYVLIDRYFKGVSANVVLLDNYRSAYDAVNFLIKKGRTRIATFQYDTTMCHMQDRLNGYKAALKDNGIRFNKNLTPVIPFLKIDPVEIELKIRNLVEVHKADAFFIQTTRVAIPVLQTFSDLKYKIPDDISIIFFHDNDFFKLIRPTMSAQHQPLEEMAEECVNILLSEIKGELTTKIRRVFPATIINERESTGSIE